MLITAAVLKRFYFQRTCVALKTGSTFKGFKIRVNINEATTFLMLLFPFVYLFYKMISLYFEKWPLPWKGPGSPLDVSTPPRLSTTEVSTRASACRATQPLWILAVCGWWFVVFGGQKMPRWHWPVSSVNRGSSLCTCLRWPFADWELSVCECFRFPASEGYID